MILFSWATLADSIAWLKGCTFSTSWSKDISLFPWASNSLKASWTCSAILRDKSLGNPRLFKAKFIDALIAPAIFSGLAKLSWSFTLFIVDNTVSSILLLTFNKDSTILAAGPNISPAWPTAVFCSCKEYAFLFCKTLILLREVLPAFAPPVKELLDNSKSLDKFCSAKLVLLILLSILLNILSILVTNVFVSLASLSNCNCFTVAFKLSKLLL